MFLKLLIEILIEKSKEILYKTINFIKVGIKEVSDYDSLLKLIEHTKKEFTFIIEGINFEIVAELEEKLEVPRRIQEGTKDGIKEGAKIGQSIGCFARNWYRNWYRKGYPRGVASQEIGIKKGIAIGKQIEKKRAMLTRGRQAKKKRARRRNGSLDRPLSSSRVTIRHDNPYKKCKIRKGKKPDCIVVFFPNLLPLVGDKPWFICPFSSYEA